MIVPSSSLIYGAYKKYTVEMQNSTKTPYLAERTERLIVPFALTRTIVQFIGEDDENQQYNIFHPSAGAANEQVRVADDDDLSDGTDADNEDIFSDECGGPIPLSMINDTIGNNPDDVTNDTKEADRV